MTDCLVTPNTDLLQWNLHSLRFEVFFVKGLGLFQVRVFILSQNNSQGKHMLDLVGVIKSFNHFLDLFEISLIDELESLFLSDLFVLDIVIG